MLTANRYIIPRALRTAHRWETGQELIAIDVGDGISLKPKKAFSETNLEEVAGCLKYAGKPKSLDELEDAIRLGVMEQWHDYEQPTNCLEMKGEVIAARSAP